jgi:hypothetical protein
MLNVEKFIEKLLLKHDCVIIPALGGFVAHYEPAYQDKESGLFYPPSRIIGFNAQLRMNDGLLAQAYMQAYDTNFPEANRMVERESEKIKTALHAEGAFMFENLGLLELKDNSRLLFTPQDGGGIAAPYLYGLNAFLMKPYEAPKEHADVHSTTVAEHFEREHATQNEAPKTISHKKSNYTIHLNKTAVNFMAAAIVAIVFYFALAIPVTNNAAADQPQLSMANGALYGFPIQGLIQQQNVPNQHEQTMTPTKDSRQQQVAKNIPPKNVQTVLSNPSTAEKHVTVQNDNSATADKVLTTQKEETPYYTIVLASSIQKKNADIFVKQLVQEGYQQSRVFQKNKMLRVIYSKYSSEEDARKDLNRLRQNDSFKEAWILQVN